MSFAVVFDFSSFYRCFVCFLFQRTLKSLTSLKRKMNNNKKMPSIHPPTVFIVKDLLGHLNTVLPTTHGKR